MNYWVEILNNELLYSFLSRYSLFSDEVSHQGVSRVLFGQNLKAVFEYSSNLDFLSKNFNHFDIISSIDIIQGHTLFNYWTAFMSETETEKSKLLIAGKGTKKGFGKLGLLSIEAMKLEQPRFCAKCLEEAKSKYGFTYYDRIHQMPLAVFCYKHKTEVLRLSNTNVRSGNRYEYIFDTELFLANDYTNFQSILEIDGQRRELTYTDKKFIRRIQADSLWLLENLKRFDKNHFISKFFMRLEELGLISIEGFLRKEMLLSRIEDLTSDYLREVLPLSFDNLDWLYNIIRKNNSRLNVSRVLFLTQVLDLHVEELFTVIQDEEEYYPCLNPASSHFRDNIINPDEVITTVHGRTRELIYTLKCPVCGFTYTRKKYGDVNKALKIKDFGWEWKAQLSKLQDRDDLSIKEKARSMKCHPATIKKYIREIKIAGN